MIIYRKYDETKGLDRVWFKSSNIFYAECDDKVNDLKTVRVVFNKGQMYEYHDVDVFDYLMFVRGGVDGSNGKALKKHIIAKYKGERKENADLQAITDEMNKLIKEEQKNG